MPSNNLGKYEYLTDEDLGPKFGYSPLGKTFNNWLKEEDKKEGLLKRKNIEDKNEEQLRGVKSKAENIKEVTNFVNEPLSLEAKELIEEIRVIQKILITGNVKNYRR